MLAGAYFVLRALLNRRTYFFERPFHDLRHSPSKHDLMLLYSIFIFVACKGKASIREVLAGYKPHYFDIGLDVVMTVIGHPLLYMIQAVVCMSIYFALIPFGVKFWRWYLWLFFFAATAQFAAEIIFTLCGKGLLQDTDFINNLHDPRMTWTAACYDQVKLQDPHALEKSQYCYGGYNITKELAMEQTQGFRTSLGYSKSMAIACDALYSFVVTIPNHIPIPGEIPEPYRGRELTERWRKYNRRRMIETRERNVRRCYSRHGWNLVGKLEYENCEKLEFCQWTNKTMTLSEELRHAVNDRHEGPKPKLIYPSDVKTWKQKFNFWWGLTITQILLRTQP